MTTLNLFASHPTLTKKTNCTEKRNTERLENWLAWVPNHKVYKQRADQLTTLTKYTSKPVSAYHMARILGTSYSNIMTLLSKMQSDGYQMKRKTTMKDTTVLKIRRLCD